MRFLVVALVLCGSLGTIAAQPAPGSEYEWRKPNTAGVFLEVGGGWERLHPANGFTYRAEYLRIAPAVSINHLLYIGAAFQFGNIYSAYGKPDSAIGAIPENTYDNEGDGTSFAGQAFLGVRDLIGIVSFGGEIAPTFRRTSAGMNYALLSDNTSITTIEIHARGDVWLLPYITAGVMIGMDVSSIRDFMGGIQIGFHVEPYDAMRR